MKTNLKQTVTGLQKEWKLGRSIITTLENKHLLLNYCVGTLVELKMHDKIDYLYVMEGNQEVFMRYMVGDLVLVSGLYEE